jgi:dimethylglycine catabolism A
LWTIACLPNGERTIDTSCRTRFDVWALTLSHRRKKFRIGDAVAARNIHAALYDALRLCKDL